MMNIFVKVIAKIVVNTKTAKIKSVWGDAL